MIPSSKNSSALEGSPEQDNLSNPAEYYKWYFSEHAIAHIDSMSKMRWTDLAQFIVEHYGCMQSWLPMGAP